ncbi:MAG: ABC transporter permease [Chloroflexi bacterium]|nr:ABC transporter permease [Chloroflexota bacterium]MCC6896059.1 ABC transporter permease [Anaerolineae bacterium]
MTNNSSFLTATMKPTSAFDDVKDDHSEKRLGRDFVALVTLFLIVVTYHLQNPLLLELQFGQAWRNPSLQPVLGVALAVCVYILAGRWKDLRRDTVKLVAMGILVVFTAYVLLDIILHINLLALVTGVSQDIFHAELSETSPLASIESALTISSLLEYLALIAVIIIWSPWKRLGVYAEAARRNAAPLIVAIVVLVLLEVLLTVFNVQQFLLPKPSVILGRLFTLYDQLITVGWNTFQNALWGFVWGCGLGILTGLVSARFTNFSKALMPLAIAANSVPIIAFAPIFNTWFGALNPASKVAIVAVLTYFPAMISTVKGLNSVDYRSLELMRSYAATDMEIFRKLRFPSALPFIFSALKVATTLAMIGAIVSEYFGGSTKGLGYRIREDAQLFRYPESWSAIIVAAALGILFYMVVSAVERGMMPWHISFREE